MCGDRLIFDDLPTVSCAVDTEDDAIAFDFLIFRLVEDIAAHYVAADADVLYGGNADPYRTRFAVDAPWRGREIRLPEREEVGGNIQLVARLHSSFRHFCSLRKRYLLKLRAEFSDEFGNFVALFRSGDEAARVCEEKRGEDEEQRKGRDEKIADLALHTVLQSSKNHGLEYTIFRF